MIFNIEYKIKVKKAEHLTLEVDFIFVCTVYITSYFCTVLAVFGSSDCSMALRMAQDSGFESLSIEQGASAGATHSEFASAPIYG